MPIAAYQRVTEHPNPITQFLAVTTAQISPVTGNDNREYQNKVYHHLLAILYPHLNGTLLEPAKKISILASICHTRKNIVGGAIATNIAVLKAIIYFCPDRW